MLAPGDSESDFVRLLEEAKREDKYAAAAAARRDAEDAARARAEEAKRAERAKEKRRSIADRRARKAKAHAEQRVAGEEAHFASVAAKQKDVMRRLAEREREIEARERILAGRSAGLDKKPQWQWLRGRGTRRMAKYCRRNVRAVAMAIICIIVAVWLASLKVEPEVVIGETLPSFIKQREGSARPPMYATTALARLSLGKEMDTALANTASQVAVTSPNTHPTCVPVRIEPSAWRLLR